MFLGKNAHRYIHIRSKNDSESYYKKKGWIVMSFYVGNMKIFIAAQNDGKSSGDFM